MAVQDTELIAEDLRRIFNPLSAHDTVQQSTHDDAIFFSIDLGCAGPDNGPSEFGVSILDSRCLASLLRNDKNHTHPILSMHNYLFSRTRWQERRAKNGFRFGEIYRIPTSNRVELKQALTRIFRHHTSGNTCCGLQSFLPVCAKIISDSETNIQSQLTNDTLYRPLVLVGHDIENDLRCLSKVDFDPNTFPPVVAVFDTQKIAYGLYGRTFRLSSLCWHLDIKAKRFHISGNDAAYTMLALLRLAAETSDHASVEKIWGIISSVLAEPCSGIERVRTVTPLD